MDQKTLEEFEKLSADQKKWALEVFQLFEMLSREQQQAAVGLARALAACNMPSHASASRRGGAEA